MLTLVNIRAFGKEELHHLLSAKGGDPDEQDLAHVVYEVHLHLPCLHALSIRAFVSLLLMQSISCLWVFFSWLSILRRPAILPEIGVRLAFGKTDLLSKSRTSRRSGSLIVSRT